MTKLSWGDVGSRFYEAGADRGVLYLSGQPGVPWNGLVSVNETPTGGEPTPFYMDGQKYLNVMGLEEFGASLTAYTAPADFARCDGMASMGAGIFVGEQPRRSFGLSYRTRVGNDVDGLDHGYKIHLVYNAKAAPPNRVFNSVSQTAEATKFSWDISTVPEVVTGLKPSSHFVIDSRKANPILLGVLEAVLYGVPGRDPRLPSVAELMTWASFIWMDPGYPVNVKDISSGTATTLTDRASFGSFETVQPGTIEVRRNLATDPVSNTSASPVANQIGWGQQWFGSGGGAGTTSNVVGASDGPIGLTSYRRKTWTVSPQQNIDTGFNHRGLGEPNTPMDLNTILTASSYIRSSSSKRGRMRVLFHAADGSTIHATAGPLLDIRVH